MTSKEKAEELINKFIPHTRVFHEVLGWEDYIDSAKECALIAVDEIISVVEWYDRRHISNQLIFWIDVKTELTIL